MIPRYINNVLRKFSSKQDTRKPLIRFCEDLKNRGLLSASQPGDILENNGILLQDLPASLYAGFDPTANSLHIGHLFILNGLLRSSKLFDCKPISLIGGATALIGDPSGRNSERPQISKDDVLNNTIAIKKQIEKIYSNANINSKIELEILSNMDWYKDMSMIDYLRLSKKFRVGEMLRMGAVKARLEGNTGISFTEFAYQTLQSYDFYFLSKTKNCFFQIGGSDQLGHINSGYNYIKRCTGKLSGGICLPLLTDDSGNKIGKSSGNGNVWLDKEKTSPYAFYQFFRQLHDDIVEKMLLSLSLIDLVKINDVIKDHRSNLGKWVAQDFLAEEMTLLVHGVEGLESAKRCSNLIFKRNFKEVDQISETELEELFGASSFNISKDSVTTYGDLADLTRNDKNRGKQLMTEGSFKINGILYTDPNKKINFSEILLRNKNKSIVSWGKRKFFLVKWV
uniref:Tyrosine--tRNA ligase n=1 Tax=Strongyloides venezuelensis TaxID=75913 RepID=A0A0K0FM19_STRVS